MKTGSKCVVPGPSVGRFRVLLRPTLMAFLVAPALSLLGGDLVHTPISCVAVGDHAVIRADLEPGTPATSVRVQFRLVGSAEEYFVEMRNREGSKYTGVLPSPVKEGDTIRYSIVVRGDRAEMLRTPQHYAKVREEHRGRLFPWGPGELPVRGLVRRGDREDLAGGGAELALRLQGRHPGPVRTSREAGGTDGAEGGGGDLYLGLLVLPARHLLPLGPGKRLPRPALLERTRDRRNGRDGGDGGSLERRSDLVLPAALRGSRCSRRGGCPGSGSV